MEKEFQNSRFNHASILIVDDSPTLLELIKEILSSEGYLIDTSESGAVALQKAKTNNYDLFLLDIMMPGLDGFTLCKHLKKNTRTKDIPVIFLTARMDENSINVGFDVGAVDYIMKPFRTKELISRIKTHIHLRITSKKLEQELNEKEQTQHSIADKENLLHTCFNISTEGMRVIGLDKKIIVANQRYADYCGITVSEVANHSCDQLLSSNLCNNKQCPLMRIVDGEKEIIQEIEVNVQGAPKYFLFRALPVFNHAQKLTAIFERFSDITQLKEAERSRKESEKNCTQLSENVKKRAKATK